MIVTLGDPLLREHSNNVHYIGDEGQSSVVKSSTLPRVSP